MTDMKDAFGKSAEFLGASLNFMADPQNEKYKAALISAAPQGEDERLREHFAKVNASAERISGARTQAPAPGLK
jgi:hypothetical protein